MEEVKKTKVETVGANKVLAGKEVLNVTSHSEKEPFAISKGSAALREEEFVQKEKDQMK